MRLAEKKDKELAVSILCESFDSNPSVNWVIKNDNKRKKRIKILAEYAFDIAYRRMGVFITADNAGVLVCYKFNHKKTNLSEIFGTLKLAFGAIGLSRALKIQKRETFIRKHRPANGNFLYFWFWGIKSDERGKSAAQESKKFVFELSKRLQLPIYLETSVLKNKQVYERYGFETYSLWQNDIKLWLMKREVPIEY